MISEPNGLSDQSFHRHRKSPSNKDNSSQQDQNEDDINIFLSTESEKENENIDKIKSISTKLDSTVDDLIVNDSLEEATNQFQNETENESKNNNSELTNILKFGLNIDSEATFISQSDYYKEDKNNYKENKSIDDSNINSEIENATTVNHDVEEENHMDYEKEDTEHKEEEENENLNTNHGSSENHEIEVDKEKSENTNEEDEKESNEMIDEEIEEDKIDNVIMKKEEISDDFEEIESDTAEVNVKEEVELKREENITEEAKEEIEVKEDEQEEESKKDTETINENEKVETEVNEEDAKTETETNEDDEKEEMKTTDDKIKVYKEDAKNEIENQQKAESSGSNALSISKNEENQSIPSSNPSPRQNQIRVQFTITNNILIDSKPNQTSNSQPKNTNDTITSKPSEIHSNQAFSLQSANPNYTQTSENSQKPIQTPEQEHAQQITEISEEAVNNRDYSRITTSNYNEVIACVRRMQRDALKDGDYELADRSQKATNRIVRHINDTRIIAITEAKTSEMSQQLQATRNDLQYLREHWRAVLESAEEKMRTDIDSLLAENEKELSQFDESVRKRVELCGSENESAFIDKEVMPIEYRKFSSELLLMRNRQKALITARRYKEARRVKDEADRLEKIELERNYERYLKRLESKRNELLKKQENKVFVRKQNWEKSLQEIRRVSAEEIGHAEKCANQLERKIESAEEFNMTIKSPRNGKMKSENVNRTSAILRTSQKVSLTPRVIRNRTNKLDKEAQQFRKRTLINRITYSNLIVQPKVKKPKSPR